MYIYNICIYILYVCANQPLDISSCDNAPFKSCLLAKINKDAPASFCISYTCILIIRKIIQHNNIKQKDKNEHMNMMNINININININMMYLPLVLIIVVIL